MLTFHIIWHCDHPYASCESSLCTEAVVRDAGVGGIVPPAAALVATTLVPAVHAREWGRAVRAVRAVRVRAPRKVEAPAPFRAARAYRGASRSAWTRPAATSAAIVLAAIVLAAAALAAAVLAVRIDAAAVAARAKALVVTVTAGLVGVPTVVAAATLAASPPRDARAHSVHVHSSPGRAHIHGELLRRGVGWRVRRGAGRRERRERERGADGEGAPFGGMAGSLGPRRLSRALACPMRLRRLLGVGSGTHPSEPPRHNLVTLRPPLGLSPLRLSTPIALVPLEVAVRAAQVGAGGEAGLDDQQAHDEARTNGHEPIQRSDAVGANPE